MSLIADTTISCKKILSEPGIYYSEGHIVLLIKIVDTLRYWEVVITVVQKEKTEHKKENLFLFHISQVADEFMPVSSAHGM